MPENNGRTLVFLKNLAAMRVYKLLEECTDELTRQEKARKLTL